MMILKFKSTGPEVKALQEQLIKWGYFVGKSGADGHFGAYTETAVKAFQTSNKLTADGIVGHKTMVLLNLAELKAPEDAKPVPKPESAQGKYTLSALSGKRLERVHPDLVKVVHRAIAITKSDFMVLEGARTLEQQKEYVRKGHSKTMRSRHLPSSNACKMSCAVDLVPLVGGKVTWDWQYYYPLAETVKRAAKEVGVTIEWGGDWKTFKDGPHFQLPWSIYK